MHKLIPVLIIALFGFGSADGQYKNATDDTSVVAEVDGEHIYLERFRNEYIDHLFKTGIADSPRVRNAFLERTIQKMLVVQQARKSRVVEQPGFELERARVERKLLIEGLLFAEVYSRVEVSESDLREMFVRVNTSITARHLYAPTKTSADALYQRLQSGENFETLAAIVFKDSVLSSNGGLLEPFGFDEMDPAFEDAAYKLAIGEVSEPVRTAQGYSIIKVEDRFLKPILTESEFANKRDRLAAYVTVKKRESARRQFLADLSEALNIVVLDETMEKFLAELHSGNIESGEDLGLSESSPLLQTATGVITVADVLEEAQFTSDRLRSHIRTAESLEAFVRGVALRKEMVHLASRKHVGETDAFAEAFQAAMDEWLYAQAWNEWRSSIIISSDQARAYHERNEEEFLDSERREIWEIVVQDEDRAIALAQEANRYNFEKLALMHSIRPGADDNRGFLGALSYDEMGVVGDIVFSANPDEIIGPIPVGGRFAIFKVGKIIPPGPAPFDVVESEIVSRLEREELRKLIRDDVQELRANALIQELLFDFEL